MTLEQEKKQASGEIRALSKTIKTLSARLGSYYPDSVNDSLTELLDESKAAISRISDVHTRLIQIDREMQHLKPMTGL